MPDTDPAIISALYRKFGAACRAMESIQRDGSANTGTYTYTYVSLNRVLREVNNACLANGLALSQPIEPHGEEHMRVGTMLTDMDTGHALTFGGPVIRAQGNPQAVGSAITYYRRYALVSLFGLATEDDDGGSAMRQAERPTARTEAETQIREIRGAMDSDERAAFDRDFMENFNARLLDLPETRHGEALTWTHWWTGDEIEDPPATLEGTTE